MVGPFQLVLDQHPVAGRNVAAEDVRPERPHGLLAGLQLELEAERLAQHGEVLRLRQPRREARGFAGPDGPEIVALEPSQCKCSHVGSLPYAWRPARRRAAGRRLDDRHIARRGRASHSKVPQAPTFSRKR